MRICVMKGLYTEIYQKVAWVRVSGDAVWRDASRSIDLHCQASFLGLQHKSFRHIFRLAVASSLVGKDPHISYLPL